MRNGRLGTKPLETGMSLRATLSGNFHVRRVRGRHRSHLGALDGQVPQEVPVRGAREERGLVSQSECLPSCRCRVSCASFFLLASGVLVVQLLEAIPMNSS